MKIVIIIPTYNEKDNVDIIIEELQSVFDNLPYYFEILVVDDNSPDGTSFIVKEKMAKYSNIHLLCGEKKGLGTAYIRGMIFAISSLEPDVVMEMDADLSHKPSDVPRLISEIENGSDFVIGSRYVAGGKLPEDWGMMRKALSKGGNLFARHIAGLSSVSDCTAGFRAIRSSLLGKVGLEELQVEGYVFQIALLKKALAQKAKINEIPVEFVNRKKGNTKLGLLDIIEFFLFIGILSFKGRLWQAKKAMVLFLAH